MKKKVRKRHFWKHNKGKKITIYQTISMVVMIALL